MADITTSKMIAAARLKTHVFEMQLQLQRIEERRLVIQDELQKIAENESAAKKDLDETNRQLAQLGGN